MALVEKILNRSGVSAHHPSRGAESIPRPLGGSAIIWLLNKLIARFGLEITKPEQIGHLEIKHNNFVVSVRPAFVKNLVASLFFVNPDMIIGEGFMRGEWWVKSGKLEDVIGALYEVLESGPLSPLARRVRKLRFERVQANHPVSSRRNISAHYDAWNMNNDLFKAMLGNTMMYSSAIYDKNLMNEDLDVAQKRKIELICAMVNPYPGESIIDIGCGWGHVSRELANRGGKVTGITISREQFAWCVSRRISTGETYLFEDYRDHFNGTAKKYDQAVCIEALDHIGLRQIDGFFATVAKALVPDGKFTLQLIIRPKAGITTKWIDKYIYPGGYITSYDEVSSAFRRAGFAEIARHDFGGSHYARTLEAWRDGLDNNWSVLANKYGYTTADYRMWMFFFASAISVFRNAGFKTMQVRLARV